MYRTIWKSLMIFWCNIFWSDAAQSNIDEIQIRPCIFNSMCSCSSDQFNPNPSIDSIACYSVPFYKFPTMPVKLIDRIEILDSMIPSLEADTLNSCELQALVFNNNKLQHISEKVFSSSLNTLHSVDLSYNRLDAVPFHALKDLKILQWLNLQGNQISIINGEWYQFSRTLQTLLIGQNDLTEIADTSSILPHIIHTGIRQLKLLTWFNANANRIHKIHKHSLPSSLKTVSLSFNLIENFPLDIIETMPNLQWLYLRDNHIKNIPEHRFENKFYIQKIDLNQNYLKSLPINPFNGSISVRDMFLSMNEFETVRNHSFNSLECRRIILSYNAIDNIEHDAFQGVLQTLEYLDLDHNKLKTIPTAINQLLSLRFLYLSSNFLRELPTESFQYFADRLKELSLGGNRFSKIPSDALRNLSKLSYFSMASNQINQLYQDDFDEWGETLQILNLNNNRLTSFDSKIFDSLIKLKELSVSYNPLRNIDVNAFSNLTAMHNLELTSSFERDDFPYEVFNYLTELKYLYLDHNNFHELKFESFDSLFNIEYLNLDSNKLEIISTNLFKPHVHMNLSSIVLSNNELLAIETGTFKHLHSLEVVWLNDNKLREINVEAFSNLPKLNVLILKNNVIEILKNRSFYNLPSLKQIELQYNRLTNLSLDSFTNLNTSFSMNCSYNLLSSCVAFFPQEKLEVFDLRHNKFSNIPKCLSFTSFLKKLNLNHNFIESLDNSSFKKLLNLEQLNLRKNIINSIDKMAFAKLGKLQVLDLSKNSINYLHNCQFCSNLKLRILKLKENSLSYLSRDVFANTQLEFLDISYNAFSVVPRESLSDIGISLRYLNMQSNLLDHIDVTTFLDIQFINHLDLSHNKLTILPDNVFTQLSLLQYLDLGFNPLRANFKEVFHYAQNLKHLSLANTGLIQTPNFPLPDLLHLNLSFNNLQSINKNYFQSLKKLKTLDLKHCNLNYVPSQLWPVLPNLKELDLSHNLIKEITVESFHGLKSLQNLNIQYLKQLSKFEGKSFVQLRILSDLFMQTWPRIENFYEEFCYLLTHMSQLRRIKLDIMEHALDEQLSCINSKKITHLEITGRNLQSISRGAFSKLTKNPTLTIKISNTQVADLPTGLFSHMHHVQHLTIDLSDNMLNILIPETFYGNFSTWDDIGTGLVAGGLLLSGNRFRCGCHLAWLGHWLRRWSRENFNPRISTIEDIHNVQEIAKNGYCWDSSSEKYVPIMKLPPVDMSCQASALSSSGNSWTLSQFGAIIVFSVGYLVGFGS